MRASLVLAFLACATPALAHDVARTLPGQACTVDPLEDWSAGEKWAWHEICAGRPANMAEFSGDDAGCKAWEKEGDPADWSPERELSADFIRIVATRHPFKEASESRGIRFECAQVSGMLDLREEMLPQTLWLDNSRLPDGVSLYGARIDGDLTFDGTDIGGQSFYAVGLRVAHYLGLRNARVPGVELDRGRIGGTVSLAGARVTGRFSADELVVNGGLSLRNGAVFEKDVHLSGLSTEGNLQAGGSIFQGEVVADRIRVAGGVFLNEASRFDRDVRLVASAIGGQLVTSGSVFDGDFAADGIDVKGGVFLADTERFTGAVRLLGAQIGGQLVGSASTFSGAFLADGAEVRGALFLRRGASFDDRVSLTNLRAGLAMQLQGAMFRGPVDMSHVSQPIWF